MYLVIADVLALIISFSFFSAAQAGGERSLAMALLFTICFVPICVPLALAMIGYLIQLLSERRLQHHLLFLVFVIISSGLKIKLAYDAEYFDKFISQRELSQRINRDPALYQLQTMIAQGPRSNIEKVKEALNNGADPNASIFVEASYPVLVAAASRSDVEAVRALLMHGADPNLSSEVDSMTIANPSPLDMVFFSEHEGKHEVFNLLLEAGAKPEISKLPLGLCWQGELELYWEPTALNAVNEMGQTAFDVALHKKHYSAALVLMQAGVKSNKPRTKERILNAQGDSEDLKTLQLLFKEANPDKQ
jgi:hypothetical protein